MAYENRSIMKNKINLWHVHKLFSLTLQNVWFMKIMSKSVMRKNFGHIQKLFSFASQNA
jgi:hypothetical protein